MGKLIVGIVLLMGVFFMINHFTQFEDILDVLRHSDWRFFALALLLQAAWVVCNAATYHSVFDALGVRRRLAPLIFLAAASNFVNVVAPSMGMSGMAMLISDARKNRLPSAHATVAGALFILAEYAGFAIYLVLGLVVLFRRGNLNSPEIVASGVLLLMAMILLTILYLGMRSAVQLGNLLKGCVRFANSIVRPFIHREYLSEKRAEQFAHDIAEGLSELHNEPSRLWRPLLFALISKGILLLVLALMFLAFQVEISVGTLLAGFAIAYLFVIVSPTPAGVGVVEGLLALALTSMFVPVDEAAVVVLGYRVITFWLPLFFGMLSFQVLHLKKPTAAAQP
jgi:uncharacterized protein (TIRG00374 family)